MITVDLNASFEDEFMLQMPLILQNRYYLVLFIICRVYRNTLVWRRGVMVVATTQILLTKPEVRFCQVQILIAGCQKFTMVRISGNGPGWK